jgi:hypothetical protein
MAKREYIQATKTAGELAGLKLNPKRMGLRLFPKESTTRFWEKGTKIAPNQQYAVS